jgi:hypothetical protein
MAALGDNALKAIPAELRNAARAGIFKHMMINLVS